VVSYHLGVVGRERCMMRLRARLATAHSPFVKTRGRRPCAKSRTKLLQVDMGKTSTTYKCSNRACRCSNGSTVEFKSPGAGYQKSGLIIIGPLCTEYSELWTTKGLFGYCRSVPFPHTNFLPFEKFERNGHLATSVPF
jgi:hypothetical protein